MPMIRETDEQKLMRQSIGHHAKCTCAGCFFRWMRHQESREWVRKQLQLFDMIQKANEEREELRRQGKLPPDDRVYGQLVA